MNAVVDSPAIVIPEVAGTPFGGGRYVARYFIGARPFVLIVSPKDEGEIASTKWGSTKKNIAGADSYSDGLANTIAMAEAGSELGKWACGLRIDGHDDWHVPSRLQALILFGEVPDQFERDWYWTSSQVKGNAQYAWFQYVVSGHQHDGRKSYALRARAVRRVAI
jgi:hypothetical protein